MLNHLFLQAGVEAFVEKTFSLYAKGFGHRSVYFNGALGTILHACFIFVATNKKLEEVKGTTVFLVLTDAHQRAFDKFTPCKYSIDLRYRRKRALRALLNFKTFICIWNALSISWQLRAYRSSIRGDSWIQLLAAGFQVASGIRLAHILEVSKFDSFIWGSDHCVMSRTAISLKVGGQRHCFLPHGSCVGKDNLVRDREIFDCIYAQNSFQKDFFLAWEPSAKIELLSILAHPTNHTPENNTKTGVVLFLNQLDLGLKPEDGFSDELKKVLSQLNRANVEELVVVIKNPQQLSKVKVELKVEEHYFGFEEFCSVYKPGSIECIVLSSGVSVDLMLAGYDLMLSTNNPLVEDEKARSILGISDPELWGEETLYQFRYRTNHEEDVNA